jgi:hypothetical protein
MFAVSGAWLRLEHQEDVCAQRRLSLPLKRLANPLRRHAHDKAAAFTNYVATYRAILRQD